MTVDRLIIAITDYVGAIHCMVVCFAYYLALYYITCI